MSKQSQRGRARFVGFSFDTFVLTAVSEMAAHIICDATRNSITSAPFEDVHTVVSDCLSKAESQLAWGRGPDYIILRQLEALFKKNPDWRAHSEVARRELAIEKFKLSELKCKIVNKRLAFYREHWSRQNLACEVLNRASLICQEILGTLTPGDMDKIHDECKMGSGATFFHKGDDVNLFSKLSSHHSVTKAAKIPLTLFLLKSPELYRFLETQVVTEVRGNRLTTVPKDRSVDRVIAIEPSWNVFLQLGVDALMKKKLRKTGVYLRDQRRNHPPAREGSIDGSFATIDLSSASDSVSLEIVKWLFPPDWFTLLESLRSPEYTIDGNEFHSYNKFSSMGNATTFPIESTIFYAIARACYEVVGLDHCSIRVYGDDIIVDRRAALLLMEVLRFAGFVPNAQKSFVTGHFRETCGHDYLNGVNVRPVYVRRTPRVVEDIYSIYNRLLIGSMVPLPRTLSYLHSCIDRPHKGPLYMDPGELSIDSVLGKRQVWDPSKGFRTQNYFIVFDPPRRSYNREYQRFEYQFEMLDRRFKKIDLKRFTLDTLYRAFLYNLKNDTPVNPSRFRWFQRNASCEGWPGYDELVGWQCVSRSH